jgi:hypothetical protein
MSGRRCLYLFLLAMTGILKACLRNAPTERGVTPP